MRCRAKLLNGGKCGVDAQKSSPGGFCQRHRGLDAGTAKPAVGCVALHKIRGTPCKLKALQDSKFCRAHDPRMAQHRSAVSKKGSLASIRNRKRTQAIRSETPRHNGLQAHSPEATADLAIAIRRMVSSTIRDELAEILRGLVK